MNYRTPLQVLADNAKKYANDPFLHQPVDRQWRVTSWKETQDQALTVASGLQDLGLLDNGILLREFDTVVDNPNGFLNVDMLYAILTQLWFQTHCLGD